MNELVCLSGAPGAGVLVNAVVAERCCAALLVLVRPVPVGWLVCSTFFATKALVSSDSDKNTLLTTLVSSNMLLLSARAF